MRPKGRAKTTISMVMLSLVAVFILFLGKMRQLGALDLESEAGLQLDLGLDSMEGLENIVGEVSGIQSLIGTSLGMKLLLLLTS